MTEHADASHRLSDTVTPVDYDILLDTSPKRARFSGALTMTCKVSRETDFVEVNARDLALSDVKAVVVSKGRKRRIKGKAKLFPQRETAVLTFDKPLPRGRHQISLTFKGKLNPSMHGLYLAHDGHEKAICSQCEATDARGIFPCFDEPAFKATFKLAVRTDPGFTVVANGAPEKVTRTRNKPIRETHHFKRTRVISTYLFAVTVGKFEATEPRRVRRIPTRIVCGVGKLEQTKFSEDVTVQVLPWYEDYFAHRYNYQKLDQVAVPGFDAGAMENIGAIFYRQSLLLMDEKATSWAAKKRIAEVVAHEIAHQWFGNLVTMEWWDDLWLNEAFATWIAYKACDAWQPQWRMWDDYLEHKESALAADALLSTHPVYTEVSSPAEATELFDIITYEKGCAVLRMAESFLGEDAFRKGIRSYIDAFKNSNARGKDLWNALAGASKQAVDELMQSWVRQPGFPLVSVSTEHKGDSTVLHLHQQRFFASPEQMASASEALWQIPMVVRYDAGSGPTTKRLLFTDREMQVELPGKIRWLCANDDATGFYRLEPDATTLNALLKDGLAHVSAATRMSLIEDQWALVRNGRSSIAQFMDVLAAFHGERDHIVTRAIVGRLRTIDADLVEKPTSGSRSGGSPTGQRLMRDFTQWLLQPQLDDLGFDGRADESPADAVRRAAVVGALGKVARNAGVIERAAAEVERELGDPTSIEPNLAGTLIVLSALDGDRARLNRYVEEFQRRKADGAAPELQQRYLGAISSFEAPALATHVLNLCLDGTVPQDQLRTVIAPMLGTSPNQEMAWEFLKKNWAEIAPRIGSMGISRLVEATGGLPCELIDDVEKFFAAHPVEEAKRGLQKALEALRLRQELVLREAPKLSEWLRAKATREAAS